MQFSLCAAAMRLTKRYVLAHARRKVGERKPPYCDGEATVGATIMAERLETPLADEIAAFNGMKASLEKNH